MPPPAILIVEDHPMVRDLLAYRLSKAYAVQTASNGQEAFDYLQQAHAGGTLPDLILSDIEMPELNGINLRRALLDDRDLRLIPFLFLTANVDKYIPHLEELAKVEGCIAKPFAMRDVLVQINQALRSAQEERSRTKHTPDRDASERSGPLCPSEPNATHPAQANTHRPNRPNRCGSNGE